MFARGIRVEINQIVSDCFFLGWLSRVIDWSDKKERRKWECKDRVRNVEVDVDVVDIVDEKEVSRVFI